MHGATAALTDQIGAATMKDGEETTMVGSNVGTTEKQERTASSSAGGVGDGVGQGSREGRVRRQQ